MPRLRLPSPQLILRVDNISTCACEGRGNIGAASPLMIPSCSAGGVLRDGGAAPADDENSEVLSNAFVVVDVSK